MDVQIKELIDKIKNDGVKTGEESAARIIADAESRAADILKKAKSDADTLVATAKADAAKAERSGQEALRQAGRDLVLTVRSEIEGIFAQVMEAETAGALSGSVMTEAVSAAVKALAGDSPGDFDVLVPESSMANLETGLKSALGAQLSAGMEIRPFKGLEAGFRLSRKDGSAFFDFSDKEIAAMLGRYLNPKLAELLSE